MYTSWAHSSQMCFPYQGVKKAGGSNRRGQQLSHVQPEDKEGQGRPGDGKMPRMGVQNQANSLASLKKLPETGRASSNLESTPSSFTLGAFTLKVFIQVPFEENVS